MVTPVTADDGIDPVLVQRAQWTRWVSLGQRTGYALFGLAIVVFVIGFIRGFTDTTVGIVVACLIVGSIILAPAIVFGYGLKSAQRADDGEGWRPDDPRKR